MAEKILIIQTAFPGDVILTLPMLQVLKREMPDSVIDFLCIPKTAEIAEGNPLINERIIYDKKNSGLNGFSEMVKKLRRSKYDILISPHRSFRSTLISFFSGAKKTISFDTSAMSFMYETRVKYEKDIHEILRNISLLKPLGIIEENIIRPELFIHSGIKEKISDYLIEKNLKTGDKFICIAPGSVWFTKRYPKEKFTEVCDLLAVKNIKIFLTGGPADKYISEYIIKKSVNKNIIDATGEFTFKESAELIKRAELLLTNDSAPLHLANAVGTKVLAIFGATIPAFGFYPYGKEDIVFEINGLKCRPCSIHGGNQCPVKTFDCMERINPKAISENI
ncbi:MAG TPA: glycosyltransferase family 9 protein [Ignavibacteria bacterium]|nr:glycosyltransferase family 9 protein [Ignavibacteria bacterium]HMR39378.1 glycosyltransferase family 9 protein [Ignavibacteria bacterium]